MSTTTHALGCLGILLSIIFLWLASAFILINII